MFPRGSYHACRPIVSRNTHYCLLFTTNLRPPCASSKIILSYFQPFLDENREKPDVKFEKETGKNPLLFQLFIRYKPACLQKNGRTTTIHSGIFLGRESWADSVSLRSNTNTSRDQLKPIRIGKRPVVNMLDRIGTWKGIHQRGLLTRAKLRRKALGFQTQNYLCNSTGTVMRIRCEKERTHC